MFNLKGIGAAFGCVSIGLAMGYVWPSPTRLSFLSVGQGDCAVFQHQGTTILIDCGPKNPHIDAGAKIVVPDLRGLGVNGVDLILLSHPDIDHIGGTGAVLKAFPEAVVAISACFREDSHLLELIRGWGRQPEDVRWLGPEYVGSIGDFKIRIDCPQTYADEETNDGSMIVKLWHEGASAVFSGDAPAKVEEAFSPVGDWRSEIMKAGHHGSRSATSEEWIQAVQPKFAVLSCGLNNEYHHPHKEVVERLKADGVKILRTDQDGDLRFELKDGRFERE